MAQIIRVGLVLMAGIEPATFRLSIRDHATIYYIIYILFSSFKLNIQTDISNIDILFTDPSVSRKLISCKLLLENSQTEQYEIISIKHVTQNSSQGISGTDLLS